MNEQLPPMPDDVRALLDAAAPPVPSAEFEARVFSRISASLAPPVAAPAPPSGAGTAGAIAVKKGTLAMGALLLLGAGVGGGVLLGRTVLAPPPVTVVAEAPPKPAPPAVVPEPVVVKPAEPPPVKVEEPRVARPVVKAPTASRDTELSSERALLEVARTSLAKGDVTATLDAVRKHEKDFANGRLVEEREVLFIQALVQAGKKDEATKRAQEFRKRFPDSLMLPAVDAVLAPQP